MRSGVGLVNGLPHYQGSESLGVLLKEFEEAMVTAGCAVRSYLEPGLPIVTTRAALASADLGMNTEILDWFAWSNGSDIALPGIFPNSIADCISRYHDHLSWLAEPEPGLEGVDYGAPAGWLPLEPDNNGLAVECAPRSTPEVRMMSADFETDGTYARCYSLRTIVAFALEGMANGAFHWDPKTATWPFDFAKLPTLQRESGLA